MTTETIVDGVPAPQPVSPAKPPHRPRTIAWGAASVSIGVLLLALALGYWFSPFAILISILGLLGLVALLLAVIPQPAPPVEVVSAPQDALPTQMYEPEPSDEPLAHDETEVAGSDDHTEVLPADGQTEVLEANED